MNHFAAENMDVFFGKTQVLRGAHFTLSKGEVVGLIGPNGAGKSTLLKAALHLIKPSSGRILLEGKPMESISSSLAAQKIGYLAQERPVHWPLTVERIVSLGRIPYLGTWGISSLIDQQSIMLAMKATGTHHLAHRPFDQLSGGEKALVMLARVLAGDPSIIFADEPANGLDPNHALEIFTLLRSLAAKGTAVLLVLHDLTAAARFCDRLILMAGGVIHATGKPSDVLTPENLENIYGVRADFMEKNGQIYILPRERV